MKPLRNIRLTKEEKEIESAIERGDYTSVKNFKKEKNRFEEIAKSTLAKSKQLLCVCQNVI